MHSLRWKFTVPIEGPPSHQGPSTSLIYLPVAALVAVALLLSGNSTPATEGPLDAAEQVPSFGGGLRTIALDPGHGGRAAGAPGIGGLSEKDITLDIAVRLRELIYRRLGLQVFMTREDDVDLDLDSRTEKANNWEADLFVSIHANAYRVNDVRGPETYFLSDAASDTIASGVAQRENEGVPQAVRGIDGQALDFILWDLAHTQHLRESSLLAEEIQQSMNGLWQLRDRGIKQAPLRVLKGATMPAVLVELGYLSNPADAAMIADSGFRQQLAEALFRGIDNFRQQHAVLAGAPNP
jgi:N-acetylmuramoyl-L-alanine amidase